MKRLAILGSTGSIGKNCLAVARALGKERIEVVAIAAKSNIDLLEAQAKEFQPKLVCLFDEELAPLLQKRIPHIPVVAKMEGLEAVATHEKANFVISAMNGAMGLRPTMAAISAKKNIGFANKEVLVSGGSLVMQAVKAQGIEFIPIDSELTAIFQCLKGEKAKSVRRIIITASGGPFRNHSQQQLEQVTVEEALKHPNYRMGAKVTIDSSTLMNKGIEMIEAHWLFGLPLDQIEVLVHPEQVVHGLVEFCDSSILAQMGFPDMIVPIQYAITYPERSFCEVPKYDFAKQGSLHFYAPDLERFRCLKLAEEAIRAGGSMPCYMNAANEVLVWDFFAKKFPWKEIARRLETLMNRHTPRKLTSLEEVFEVDALARREAAG